MPKTVSRKAVPRMDRAGWRKASAPEITAEFNASSCFTDEKAMSDCIESEIESFCAEVLGDSYIRHWREYAFNSARKSVGRGLCKKNENNVRMDFLVLCEKKTYAIKVKNPVQVFTELSRAIGQLLMYEDILSKNGISAELVLVSSKNSQIVTDVMKRHELGFRYIIYNKRLVAEYEEARA